MFISIEAQEFSYGENKGVYFIFYPKVEVKKVTTDAHKTFLTIPPRTESSFHSSTMQKLIKD